MQAVKDLNQPFTADGNGRFVGRVHDPIGLLGSRVLLSPVAITRLKNPQFDFVLWITKFMKQKNCGNGVPL
jgi:hypothetical protein